jgi:molybdopterin molybdotransferase
MRPGKPLMVGTLGGMQVLGLPGNPVSALVCALVFLKPLLHALLGATEVPTLRTARLGSPMAENDLRQDYVRARLAVVDEELVATPFETQDSSMLATFAQAGALIVRRAHAPAASKGDRVVILPL